MTFDLFHILLITHIISGTIGIFSAIGAIITPKGGTWHRQFGRGFFYGMCAIFITATPMSLLKTNTFLLLIAIFSFYLAYTGWRYAKRRGSIIPWWDWVVTIGMCITGILMIGFGLLTYQRAPNNAITIMIFGGIGSAFSLRDAMLFYSGNIANKVRIARHLGGMLGGTIAMFTAVLVTNVHIQPEVILWIGPTLVISPLIAYWTRQVMR